MTQTELRKLAEAATPGPWERSWLYEVYPGAKTKKEQDAAAAYIAAANPATVLALLARVEALQSFAAFVQQSVYVAPGVIQRADEALSAHGPDVPLEGEKK